MPSPATTTLPARIREALSSGDAALCGRLYDWVADHDDETMARVHGLPREGTLALLADAADGPGAGAYVTVFGALTRGTMTMAQAEEAYRTSVRLYGENDAQSIGYRRAIQRRGNVVMSDGGEC